jgi:hypothetical protein
MELLGDMSQMEACFGLYGDSVNLDTRSVHGLRRMYHGHANHFGCTQWNSWATWVKWKLVLVCMEITVILALDRCTVRALTMGMEIVLIILDGTPS